MIPMPRTAMVLAAGLGSRMRPLTEATPKPLLDVGGKSLIDHMLDPLAQAGVKRVVVNVHWLADQIEAHVATRSDFEVVISDERGERLETGGGLAKARPLLGDEPVFVVNTDAFWMPQSAQPLHNMAKAFDPARMDALLLVAHIDQSLGFHGKGDFFLEPSRQLTFRGEAKHAPMAYTGVRIIKPALYDDETVRAFSAVDIWKRLARAGRLYGHRLDAFWLHVGDPQALQDADKWIEQNGV